MPTLNTGDLIPRGRGFDARFSATKIWRDELRPTRLLGCYPQWDGWGMSIGVNPVWTGEWRPCVPRLGRWVKLSLSVDDLCSTISLSLSVQYPIQCLALDRYKITWVQICLSVCLSIKSMSLNPFRLRYSRPEVDLMYRYLLHAHAQTLSNKQTSPNSVIFVFVNENENG